MSEIPSGRIWYYIRLNKKAGMKAAHVCGRIFCQLFVLCTNFQFCVDYGFHFKGISHNVDKYGIHYNE